MSAAPANNNRPSTAIATSRQQHYYGQQSSQSSRKPPLQNGGGGGGKSLPSPQHQHQHQHQLLQHQQHNRPRFSPYTPPLSSSVPISSGRHRLRHATVSSDADITDPRIYPTELSSSRGQRETQAAAMSRSYDGTFFSGGAAARGHGRRGEFIIHPEWLSESVSIEKLRISERPFITTQPPHPPHPPPPQLPPQQLQHQLSLPADWPRRCKSAPPPPQQQISQPHPLQHQHQQQQHHNIITWQ